jgi:hypothetical protein
MSDPEALVPVQDALEQLRRADQRWNAAVHAFDSYPTRLRELAEAASLRSRALTLADLANITGKPRTGARKITTLAHDLTEASGRPGPKPLWRRFDKIVKDLGTALEEGGYPEVARVFAELATVASDLADAYDAEQAGATSAIPAS